VQPECLNSGSTPSVLTTSVPPTDITSPHDINARCAPPRYYVTSPGVQPYFTLPRIRSTPPLGIDHLCAPHRYYVTSPGVQPYFTLPRIRSIAHQCLCALAYLHSFDIIHCDMKPENLLIKSLSRCEVKVIDFGSSCYSADPQSSYVQVRNLSLYIYILPVPSFFLSIVCLDLFIYSLICNMKVICYSADHLSSYVQVRNLSIDIYTTCTIIFLYVYCVYICSCIY